MSITLKGKWLLLAVFISGYAANSIIRDIPFIKTAYAKSGKVQKVAVCDKHGRFCIEPYNGKLRMTQ